MQRTSGRVDANGITLAYESFGDPSAETVLLIAGLGTQMIRWAPSFCAGLVDRGFRVVRFDNRDVGCSTAFTEYGAVDFAALLAEVTAGRMPALPYTLGDMALDATGLLDALSIDRAHLVGRSMGGMIAQIMASEHASRVRSLTSIMSSSGNAGLPTAEPDAMAMMMGPAPDPMTDAAAFLNHSTAFARRIAGSAYPLDERAHREMVTAELRRGVVPGGVARQAAATGFAGDRRARLAMVKAPTVVIHGTEDALFPLACGADTAAAIPGAKWLPIQGMGHELPPPLYPTVIDAIAGAAAAQL